MAKAKTPHNWRQSVSKAKFFSGQVQSPKSSMARNFSLDGQQLERKILKFPAAENLKSSRLNGRNLEYLVTESFTDQCLATIVSPSENWMATHLLRRRLLFKYLVVARKPFIGSLFQEIKKG